MNFLRGLLPRPRPRDFIGPPDPISNIRPVVRDGYSPRAHGATHPYSLSEFSTKGDDEDLQWRIECDRLSTFNHAFWLDNNSRFMKEKQQAVAHFHELPVNDQFAKERALSTFYSRWSNQERTRQATYTAEWNVRNRAVIRLGIRRQVRLWKDTLRDIFTKS